MSASRDEKPRACTNCSRAKTKCIWPGNDGSETQICQRCSNNSLACSRLQTGVKRKRGKGTHGRVIEQKLDEILSLLNGDSEQLTDTNRSTAHRLFPPNPTMAASCDVEDSSSSRLQVDAITIIPGFEIPFDEADRILQQYMTDMLPEFPFVPLASAGAYSMSQTKPLLLKTILWTCKPPGPDLTSAFEHWFRQEIAQRTIVLMEKSLEMLQALLVFLAWNDLEFFADARETSLIQLALGLVADIGLAKRPEISGPSIVEEAAHLRDEAPARSQHTNSERRAVLGVYYITSTLVSILNKSCRLEYTNYLDDCCERLLHDAEYSTDSLLVHLIRIQQIAIKVNDTFSKNRDAATDSPFHETHALAIAVLQKELDGFMAHLPWFLVSNRLLQSHNVAIRIRLFEPAIHAHRNSKLDPSHLKSRIMWDCLKSTRTFFDAFLSLPVESYPQFTFVPILHLALAIIKACTLLCVDDQGWDLETARSSFDFADTLQQLSSRFEACHGMGAPRGAMVVKDRPVFLGHAERFRMMRSWYLAKLDPGITRSTSPLIQEQLDGFDFWQHLPDLTYGLL